jgi:hypothetical protein
MVLYKKNYTNKENKKDYFILRHSKGFLTLPRHFQTFNKALKNLILVTLHIPFLPTVYLVKNR